MSETIIEINLTTGTAVEKTYTSGHTHDAQDFLDRIKSSGAVSVSYIPDHAIIYRKENDREVWVTYQPPGLAKCGFSVIYSGSRYEYLNLPVFLPARISIYGKVSNTLRRELCKHFFTNKVTKKEVLSDLRATKLQDIWLPNTYSAGEICAGHEWEDYFRSPDHADEDKIDYTTDLINNSNFNSDLDYWMGRIPGQAWDLLTKEEYSWDSWDFDTTGAWEYFPKSDLTARDDINFNYYHAYLVKALVGLTQHHMKHGGEQDGAIAITEINNVCREHTGSYTNLDRIINSYLGGS